MPSLIGVHDIGVDWILRRAGWIAPRTVLDVDQVAACSVAELDVVIDQKPTAGSTISPRQAVIVRVGAATA